LYEIFIKITLKINLGWLFKVELSNPDEVKVLMDEKQYEEFLKTDHH